MNWLRRFFYGRYGADQLGMLLLALYFIFVITARLFHCPWLYLPMLLVMGLALFRMLSKNINRRARENMAFLRILNPIKAWIRKLRLRIRDRKYHRYFSCPACKKDSRVPKGKGKIEITCPHCGHRFIKKT